MTDAGDDEDTTEKINALTQLVKALTKLVKAEVTTPLGLVDALIVVALIVLLLVSPTYFPRVLSPNELFVTIIFMVGIAYVSANNAQKSLDKREAQKRLDKRRSRH